MDRVPGLPSFRWAFAVGLLLLPCAPAAGASSLVVQQIGELSGEVAEAVAAEVMVVPLSPDVDPRTTPIILAPGTAFVGRDGEGVGGLQPRERRAIQLAYDAGQVILLPHASTHDIDALHMLVDDGVAQESSTDPVALAYALRKENDIPTARLVTDPVEHVLDADDLDKNDPAEDEPAEEDPALSRALEVVVAELTRPPATPEVDDAAREELPDWGNSPVQKTTLTSTELGVYHLPAEVYALHSCRDNIDGYLVNTGGDWRPTQAKFQSAAAALEQIDVDPNGNLTIDWQNIRNHCFGGQDLFWGADSRICRYIDYPLSYTVDLEVSTESTVLFMHEGPWAVDYTKSGDYRSGIRSAFPGPVNVSGNGPSSGIQPHGVFFNNEISTQVPPLVTHVTLGESEERAKTQYLYCTSGDRFENCRSTIQMTGAAGLCFEYVVGDPQTGQTPNGRLSGVSQTALWHVDPASYTGPTFDITVTFEAELATSTSNLWIGKFGLVKPVPGPRIGPEGYCDKFGCWCKIDSQRMPIQVSHTFKVPRPSTECPP
jgi:hypothetical protein